MPGIAIALAHMAGSAIRADYPLAHVTFTMNAAVNICRTVPTMIIVKSLSAPFASASIDTVNVCEFGRATACTTRIRFPS